MKARVKATGKIVEVAYHGLGVYVDMNQWDKEYQFDEIIVLDNGDPDYWDKLLHQYAGMAMQGMLNNSYLAGEFRKYPNNGIEDMSKIITKAAVVYATALVEKLKGE